MKKLVTAFAACMIAGLVSAAVESQNIVGYVTRSINTEAGEFMVNVGVPLKNMASVDGSFSVTNTLFSYDCMAGDTVYVFNPGNWDLDIYTFVGVDQGWSVSWSDGSVSLEPAFNVAVGANLFFAPADGVSSLTIAGEVNASGAQEVVFDPEGGANWIWTIANPFPIETKLSSVETFAISGDTIYVFNPMNWDLDIYTYVGVGQGWSVSWSDGSVSLITDSDTVLFPVGTGGFYAPNGDNAVRTWTVTLNY